MRELAAERLAAVFDGKARFVIMQHIRVQNGFSMAESAAALYHCGSGFAPRHPLFAGGERQRLETSLWAEHVVERYQVGKGRLLSHESDGVISYGGSDVSAD